MSRRFARVPAALLVAGAILTVPGAGCAVSRTLPSDGGQGGDGSQRDGALEVSVADGSLGELPSRDGAHDGGPPGAGACAFATSYRYGRHGAFTAWVDTGSVSPERHFELVRQYAGGGPTASCEDDLPSCGTSGVIDVAQVVSAFDDPDVLAAFGRAGATDRSFGRRLPDLGVFRVERANGSSFDVAAACDGTPGCTEIPAGVVALEVLLGKLDAQQLARPACAAVGP